MNKNNTSRDLSDELDDLQDKKKDYQNFIDVQTEYFKTDKVFDTEVSIINLDGSFQSNSQKVIVLFKLINNLMHSNYDFQYSPSSLKPNYRIFNKTKTTSS